VSGRIQNVCYRARVVAIAKESGITGTVQNLESGMAKSFLVAAEDAGIDITMRRRCRDS
jgi:acylphosphatase